jgi:hypothetical protein
MAKEMKGRQIEITISNKTQANDMVWEVEAVQ